MTEFNLSDKMFDNDDFPEGFFGKGFIFEDVKQKIQEAKERLKRDALEYTLVIPVKEVDEIFLEVFGDKLIWGINK